MSDYQNLPLTISASGNSAGFRLSMGDHWLVIKSTGWGSATLQVSPSDAAGSYENVKDASGNTIVITGNWQFPVQGGVFYRLNVTSYSQPITVTAMRA